MGWPMTHVSFLRGERDLCDLLNMVANVTYNLMLSEDTKCNVAHAQ